MDNGNGGHTKGGGTYYIAKYSVWMQAGGGGYFYSYVLYIDAGRKGHKLIHVYNDYHSKCLTIQMIFSKKKDISNNLFIKIFT